MVKQDVYDPATAATFHIPEIVALMEHQEINHFLKFNTDNNKNLIRVFYAGL